MVDAALPPSPARAPTAKDITQAGGKVSRDEVDTPSEAWRQMEAKRALPRALLGGTEAMRAGKQRYLPKLEAEDPDLYDFRLKSSFLTPHYETAVTTLTGKVFEEALEIEAPAPVLALWPDIDRLGTVGDVFVRETCSDSMGLGLQGILVDFPSQPRDASGSPVKRTAADDLEDEIRPFWVHYDGADILEVVPVRIGSKMRPGRVRLRECRTVQSGEWGTKVEERVRVYHRGNHRESSRQPTSARWATVTSFLKTDDREWVQEGPPESLTLQVEIPFVAVPTGKAAFFFNLPPLGQAADLCLKHWQKNSHLDYALLACARPTPFVTGMDPKQIATKTLGPLSLLALRSPDAKAGWLELEGKSVDYLFRDLERLENQIRMASLEPMMRQASGDEKATIRLLDEGKASSALQTWAIGWMDAISLALYYTGVWMGVEGKSTVGLSDNVMAGLKLQGSLSELTKGALGGLLSKAAWQNVMVRGGELPEDHDIEADLMRIQADATAGMGGISGQ